MKSSVLITTKSIFLFALIFAIVLIVNHPVISFDLMYQEQPSIYLANQTVSTWWDLLQLYLHPKWLHTNIPFFRPSGHFLMYKLLMPELGWHNSKALTVIALFFLAVIGFFSIKLYKLLFPSFAIGSIVAFSFYLMHPSHTVSRITIMHFDYAYVAFTTISLYLFVKFSRLNKNYYLFALSLLFFAIAITFKEPAIMLGPVLFWYFVISRYNREPLLRYTTNIMRDKSSLFILLTITALSAALSWYLFSAWPSMNYASTSFNLEHSLGAVDFMLKDLFALKGDYIPFGSLAFAHNVWRTTVFTPASQYLVWACFWISLISTFFIFRDKSDTAFVYKKSLLFLLLACLLFEVLPICWASGAPWHHSLTLLCYSLIVGFSAEYLCNHLKLNKKIIMWSLIIISLIIGFIGVTVNFENIIKYKKENHSYLGRELNRNGVLFPPDIKAKLNNDSLIVVEDSILHNDYVIGNAAYPFLLFLTNKDYDLLQMRERNFTLQFHHSYSGNLFRFAYLMPALKEQLYPFQVEQMNDIPNEIIYDWLKHYNNIFCLGYDASGKWHDKTELFKKNLMAQQAVRVLKYHDYRESSINTLPLTVSYTRELNFPDEKLCQFTCDQDKQCRGFVFETSFANEHYGTQCHFYGKKYAEGGSDCKTCNIYTKVS